MINIKSRQDQLLPYTFARITQDKCVSIHSLAHSPVFRLYFFIAAQIAQVTQLN